MQGHDRRVRVGPASLPSRERPEEATELLVERGYDACEIEFGRGFWMEWDFAHRLGALAPDADVALSIHAPLAAFLGHADYGGRKHLAHRAPRASGVEGSRGSVRLGGDGPRA
jgi:sugar phosphate isomerase/epimerase